MSPVAAHVLGGTLLDIRSKQHSAHAGSDEKHDDSGR
jgi:hypothetical protein